MEQEIYELFFKGVETSKENFIAKVKYFKLTDAKLKKFLTYVNSDFMESLDISEKDLKVTAKKTSKEK